MKHLLFAIALFIAPFVNLQAQEGGLLWKISGNGLSQPSYLFGTFHLLDHHFIESDETILEAYKNSDAVVVETELDSSQMMQMQMMMMMPQHINTLLDSAAYAAIDQELTAQFGQGLQQLGILKPMALSSMLAMQYYAQVDPSLAELDGEPMDAWVLNNGKENGKAGYTLETLLEQSELLFNSLSDSLQATMLHEMVVEKDEMLDMSKALIEGYKAKDIAAVAEVGFQSMGDEELYKTLLFERNHNWMEQLPTILAKHQAFIAVGSLHLPGEEGLIHLLQKEGYTVTPM